MSPEDLHGDAWLAARGIGDRRGNDIDFSDPGDQDLIMRALNVRNLKHGEKNLRYASWIDETSDHGEGEENIWSNRLRAHKTSDPLELLLLREDLAKEEDALASPYTEYAAYIVALFQFKDDRLKFCAYLLICKDTLRRRMGLAEERIKVQFSLFDQHEQIDKKFMPLAGRCYLLPSPTSRHEGQQRIFGF